MNKQVIMSGLSLFVLLQSLQATPITRRATITGGGRVGGRCTIEVTVDGAAEVEVWGDTGVLKTLSGQTAVWRRFQCSEPLPSRPGDFRFAGVDGRGSIRLIRDPRSNQGTAVIRIEDRKGGREGYTFDLTWRRSGDGGWPSVPTPFPPGHYPSPGTFPMARGIQLCQDAVASRLNGEGYAYVTFERTIPDNKPGETIGWSARSVEDADSKPRDFRFLAQSISDREGSGRLRYVAVGAIENGNEALSGERHAFAQKEK
jgi:hypothetical protein